MATGTVSTFDKLHGYIHEAVLASDSSSHKRLLLRFKLEDGWSVTFVAQRCEQQIEFASLAAACRAYDA